MSAAGCVRSEPGGRVRLAAGADQLASEIMKFPTLDLDPASATAVVAVAGGAPVALILQSFGRAAGAAGIWSWVTGAFAPTLGLGAEAGDSVITVSARTLDGSPVGATATLRASRL